MHGAEPWKNCFRRKFFGTRTQWSSSSLASSNPLRSHRLDRNQVADCMAKKNKSRKPLTRPSGVGPATTRNADVPAGEEDGLVLACSRVGRSYLLNEVAPVARFARGPSHAELDYLVGSRLGVESEVLVLEELAGGAWEEPALDAEQLSRAASVVRRYADQQIGTADAPKYRARRSIPTHAPSPPSIEGISTSCVLSPGAASPSRHRSC
jgi:hypothetical protein